MAYDHVIVGGGSAGCALANRLSARSANRVLLIEAGPDYAPGREPADILDVFSGFAYFNRRHLWTELRVHQRPLPHNAPRTRGTSRYEQARVIGGGSSINGLVANRGGPMDYDAWQAKGLPGWGWEGVLPYFRRLESERDFDGPLHGRDGPIGICRVYPDRWAGFSRAVGEAFKGAGFGYQDDQNGAFGDGYFPIAMTAVEGRRHSAAMAYLTPEVRARPNLAVRCQTHVTRLLVEGRRAVGVAVAASDGGEEEIRAGEVIVSAGALHSPVLLMRAGIGPAAHLREHGLAVVHDLPGVGQNLQEHPAVTVAAFLKPEARMTPGQRRQFMVALRYSTKVAGAVATDMYVSVTNQVAWHPLGMRLGAMVFCLYKPFSTGQVMLASADWRDEPVVEFDLAKDERDARRLAAGVRFAAELFKAPGLAAITECPFPISYSDRIRKVGQPNRINWVQTGLLALALEALPFARRTMIERIINQGVTLAGLLSDEAALLAWVRANAAGVWHPSCTCRMGPEGDRMAVLDGALRVRGIDGLRVVDASAMPEVPRGNTNLPTIMVAEKAADLILGAA